MPKDVSVNGPVKSREGWNTWPFTARGLSRGEEVPSLVASAPWARPTTSAAPTARQIRR